MNIENNDDKDSKGVKDVKDDLKTPGSAQSGFFGSVKEPYHLWRARLEKLFRLLKYKETGDLSASEAQDLDKLQSIGIHRHGGGVKDQGASRPSMGPSGPSQEAAPAANISSPVQALNSMPPADLSREERRREAKAYIEALDAMTPEERAAKRRADMEARHSAESVTDQFNSMWSTPLSREERRREAKANIAALEAMTPEERDAKRRADMEARRELRAAQARASRNTDQGMSMSRKR